MSTFYGDRNNWHKSLDLARSGFLKGTMEALAIRTSFPTMGFSNDGGRYFLVFV